MKNLTLLTIAMALFLVVGCDKAEPTAATVEPATEPAAVENHDGHDHAHQVADEGDKPMPAAHAPAGYEPGSHEDWCGGHQVPESMCTRCNPTLIAGFKATGDWCAEHEMPESQCLACNPDLKIERPAKKVAQ